MHIGVNTAAFIRWPGQDRAPAGAISEMLFAARELVEVNGFSALEVGMDPPLLFPQEGVAAFMAGLAALQRELGLVCTVHLPFLWLDLASGNEEIRLASVEAMRRAVALARGLEVSTWVVHPCGAGTQNIAGRPDNSPRRLALADMIRRQANRSIGEVAALMPSRDLCVETLELPAWDFFAGAIEEHDVSICMDAGHLIWMDLDPVNFFRRNAGRIREVHLHDVLPLGSGELRQFRDHLGLGIGVMDYRGLLDALQAARFAGAVILEVFSKEERVSSAAALAPWLRPAASPAWP